MGNRIPIPPSVREEAEGHTSKEKKKSSIVLESGNGRMCSDFELPSQEHRECETYVSGSCLGKQYLKYA